MGKKPSSKRHRVSGEVRPELLEAMIRDAGVGVAEDENECLNDGLDDPLSGISFGLPVIEKFLLAIIDGHPVKGRNRRKRLDDAMTALLNRKASHGPLPQDPNKSWRERDVSLDDALLWMGRRYELARRRKPSDLSLATLATDKFFPTVDAQKRKSQIDDLRARFSGVYNKRLKHWDPSNTPDVRGTYAFRASEYDYVKESVEHQILRRVRDEFAQTGLRMILPDE
jgi:hypothetical protein